MSQSSSILSLSSTNHHEKDNDNGNNNNTNHDATTTAKLGWMITGVAIGSLLTYSTILLRKRLLKQKQQHNTMNNNKNESSSSSSITSTKEMKKNETNMSTTLQQKPPLPPQQQQSSSSSINHSTKNSMINSMNNISNLSPALQYSIDCRRLLPQTIILVRHGESEANTDKTIWKRIPDNLIGLTELGKHQAYEVGKRIRIVLHQLEKNKQKAAPQQQTSLQQTIQHKEEDDQKEEVDDDEDDNQEEEVDCNEFKCQRVGIGRKEMNTKKSKEHQQKQQQKEQKEQNDQDKVNHHLHPTQYKQANQRPNLNYSGIPEDTVNHHNHHRHEDSTAGMNQHIDDHTHNNYDTIRVHLVVSPFERTKETAAILRTQFENMIVRTDIESRIREQEVGNIQNDEFDRYRAEQEQIGRFFYRFPTGESGADVFDRVKSWWYENILTVNLRIGYEPVDAMVVVTHGLTMRFILMQLFNWSPTTFHSVYNANNCDMYVLYKDLNKPGTSPYILDNIHGDMPKSSINILIEFNNTNKHLVTLYHYLNIPPPRTTQITVIKKMLYKQYKEYFITNSYTINDIISITFMPFVKCNDQLIYNMISKRNTFNTTTTMTNTTNTNDDNNENNTTTTPPISTDGIGNSIGGKAAAITKQKPGHNKRNSSNIPNRAINNDIILLQRESSTETTNTKSESEDNNNLVDDTTTDNDSASSFDDIIDKFQKLENDDTILKQDNDFYNNNSIGNYVYGYHLNDDKKRTTNREQSSNRFPYFNHNAILTDEYSSDDDFNNSKLTSSCHLPSLTSYNNLLSSSNTKTSTSSPSSSIKSSSSSPLPTTYNDMTTITSAAARNDQQTKES